MPPSWAYEMDSNADKLEAAAEGGGMGTRADESTRYPNWCYGLSPCPPDDDLDMPSDSSHGNSPEPVLPSDYSSEESEFEVDQWK